jgi:hypothetical protein
MSGGRSSKSSSGRSLAFGYESCRLWVWSLEMVQRCCRGEGYTYEQGELRGRVGKERGGKETDGCPLTELTLHNN